MITKKGVIPVLFLVAFGVASCSSTETDDTDYEALYQMENGDAGDCVKVNGCGAEKEDKNIADNDTPYSVAFQGNLVPAESLKDGAKGYMGEIDAECHDRYIGTDGNLYKGPDVDFIPLKAEPGTPLKVKASKIGSYSRTKPVVSLMDKYGRQLLYSGDGGQLSFRMPDDLAYLAIEDGGENYAHALTQTCGSYQGGPKYRYALTVSNSDDNFTTKLEIFEESQKRTDKLPTKGGTKYYSIPVPKGAGLSVTLTSNSNNSQYAPVLSQIDRSQSGSVDWYSWATIIDRLPDEYKNGKHTMTLEANAEFASEYPLTEVAYKDYLEYVFVVSDYNGTSDYSYTITFNIK